jgi:hypothetical protein
MVESAQCVVPHDLVSQRAPRLEATEASRRDLTNRVPKSLCLCCENYNSSLFDSS